MVNNIDLIVLSTIIVTCFMVFIIGTYRVFSKLDDNSYKTSIDGGPRVALLKILTKYLIEDSNRNKLKKKNKKTDKLSEEAIRRAVSNTLADMESDGVYFMRDDLPMKSPSQDYVDKFKKTMNKDLS